MSDFQDGFFRDLWYDVLLHGARSVLCGYFRMEKRRHALTMAKKREYELAAVYGPGSVDPDERTKDALRRRHMSEDTPKRAQDDKSDKRVRKNTGEHAGVEILCGYYELCAQRAAGAKADAYLLELGAKAEAAKCSRSRKKRAAEAIGHARELVRTDGTDLWTAVEQAASQTMDLYLYAEAAQFLYNAGYPLPPEDVSEEYGGDIGTPQKKDSARIKTVPIKLLDYYFERRGLSMEQMLSVTRMQPSHIAQNEELMEKLEEVYDFACNNAMERAVIPLLIDNASGSGLYVLGRIYLRSWEHSESKAREVEKILQGRPCCYAIVKFLNLELEDSGEYFWAPYSVTDPLYGKEDVEPQNVLFGDLEKALNMYQGQLNVSSAEVLYENYRSENVVEMEEKDIPLDPQFRRYFQTKPEELDSEMADVQSEYQKKLKERIGGAIPRTETRQRLP